MATGRQPILLLPLSLGACTVAFDFDRDRVLERDDAICSDGVDNDADGLADCLDWECLDRPVCCAIPRVVLEDRFDFPGCAAASCDAPVAGCMDEQRWQPWGSPLPIVCEGALSPNKPEQCYDVGVLARDPVGLAPGLAVEV